MRIKFPHSLLSAILLLTPYISSCEPDRGKPLSDYPDASVGDSMLYYYGQLRGYDYWKMAVADTNLRSPENRELYLKGIKDGIDAVKNNDKIYNDGVRLGVRMKINLYNYEENFDVDLDDEILLESIRYALLTETDIPELKYQDNFYKLIGKMKKKRRKVQKEVAQRTLIEEARELNLAKISDDLYFKISQHGEGPKAHVGDIINVSVDFQKPDGRDLGFPTPEKVTVGAPGSADVMTQIYCRLNKGAMGVFATSAAALFGTRCEVVGVKPAQVIIIYVTLNDIDEDGEIDDHNPLDEN